MIEVKVISSVLDIQHSELKEIAKLHIAEMSETLSSMRGEETVADLYKRLLCTGGCIVLTIKELKIVGVLSYTSDYKNVASLRAVIDRPKSWFRVILRIGIVKSLLAISDSYKISRKVKRYNDQMLYITTLFVERHNQNLGLATLMFNHVKNQKNEGNRSIMVDTKLDNMRATQFYRSKGMIEYARTPFSVILKYD